MQEMSRQTAIAQMTHARVGPDRRRRTRRERLALERAVTQAARTLSGRRRPPRFRNSREVPPTSTGAAE